MKKKELYDFNEEILDEGSLYITYIYMKNYHKWSIETYIKIIKEYYENKILEIYKYGENNEFININLSDIDFNDLDSLKQYSFSRGENWTWDNLNKYYEKG